MNKNKNTLHYGLQSLPHGLLLATQVCRLLGHGKYRVAVPMLLETACVETDFGSFADPTPLGAGSGLTQLDPIGIEDVAKRTRFSNRRDVFAKFGFDIRYATQEDLYNNPLNAFIMTRLFYMLIPEHFPPTLEARAEYWKKYYNTKAGKGTPEKYIEKANRYLYNDSSPIFHDLKSL